MRRDDDLRDDRTANDKLIFSEGQVRLAFVASTFGMVAVIVAILLLATMQPQGRYVAADATEYNRTLSLASSALGEYRETEDGRITIPIERAMELVAERGVVGPLGDIQAAAGTEGGAGGEDAGGAEQTARDVPTDADPVEATGPAEVADEQAPADDEAPAGDDPAAAAQADGAQVYAACSGCHQAEGQGLAGAFPPLAGHAPELYRADREYLVRVLLYGLAGPIQVEGQTYAGVMPAWADQLSDEQIAAVLNHIVTAWGNEEALPEDFSPYAAGDVAALRGEGLEPADVHALREELELP